MLRLIIKNLWSRRKRNGWLLAELVLVSVITWVLLDSVLVNYSILNKPLGYDSKRLLLIDVAMVEPRSSRYDAQAADSTSNTENFFRLVDRIKTLDEVEQVAPLMSFAYLQSMGNSSRAFQPGTDSLRMVYAPIVYFAPGHHYFETYGIKSSGVGPGVEELSRMGYGSSDIVITRSLADYLYPDGDALGKWLNQDKDNMADAQDDEPEGFHVVGIVEDTSVRNITRTRRLAFFPDYDLSIHSNSMPHILVRLKSGVDADSYAKTFQSWMVKQLRAGNLYARTVQSYNDVFTQYEYSSGISNILRLRTALLIFFLANLCLGVIGTFWLQTRKRTEEAGVMKSFGATSGNIVRMLLGEGWILTTLAVFLGCFIYFQYAYSQGLSGDLYPMFSETFDDWIDNFGTHFGVISLITYLIILAVVLIGIYIPARSISRVNPVEALRDE